MGKKSIPHNGSYRRLFSHPQMVEQLIRRYVAPPWIDELDFSTLEMVPAHYVSDEYQHREGDVVWRLRYGPDREWFFLYLLIEFQSRAERFMVIRMLCYLMLFYLFLIDKKLLTRSGKLPPVLPLVLYNGKRRWRQPLQSAKLIHGLPGFEAQVPRFEVLLLDEGHLPREALEPLDGPTVGVFQLEQSRSLEEIGQIIARLDELLDAPELRPLRRDVATWVRRAVLPARVPGAEVPELRDLEEIKIMLAERAATWPRQWMAEGYRKGRREGRLEGRQEGRLEGRLEGQRTALTELVTDKLGPLGARHKAQIAGASADQLARWLKNVLTAATVDDVFRT